MDAFRNHRGAWVKAHGPYEIPLSEDEIWEAEMEEAMEADRLQEEEDERAEMEAFEEDRAHFLSLPESERAEFLSLFNQEQQAELLASLGAA